MREGKFISIKYTRRYIYAHFGTFLAPTGIYTVFQKNVPRLFFD